jgi:hypothetical protein
VKEVIILRLKRKVFAPLYLCFQVDQPDIVVGIITTVPERITTVVARVKSSGEKIICRI